MGAFLLHRHEWSVAFVALLCLLIIRIDNTVKTTRARAKYEEDPSFYKDAHQADMIKEWVTSQYCKQDLDILCPVALSVGGCQAAFDPSLRFVLDLDATTTTKDQNNMRGNAHTNTKHCSMAELIGHTDWKDRDSIRDSNEDDTLIYFIAHLLEQVRTKAAKHFRAEDRSILEFEQSRLIGSVLASVIDLFSSPTQLGENGKTVSTKARDFAMTKHTWTRDEVISLMHDAVFWHTHHKRHGSTANGAAARVSRQMPSFVFKFLPLVNEQIQDLETDNALAARLQKLYSLPKTLGSHNNIALSLDQERPQSDQCLWSHYEEGSLISQDCMLALETAPLKIRDLDWEGSFSLVLIYIYTCFSGAYMLWMLSRLRRKPTNSSSLFKKNDASSVTAPLMAIEVEYPFIVRETVNDRQDSHHGQQERKRQQMICLVYLVLSCAVGWASSSSSETIQFSDFLDGICMVLVGFLSLHLKPSKKWMRQTSQASRDRHYKKRASLLDEHGDAA